MDIPEKHINFCQAVGRLAREYGLSELSGSFQDFGFSDARVKADLKRITFNWSSGRHNIGVGNIAIHAETWLHTRVDEELPS